MMKNNVKYLLLLLPLLIVIPVAYGDKSCDTDNGYERYWVESRFVPDTFRIDRSSQWLCLTNDGYNSVNNNQMISIYDIGNYIVRNSQVVITPINGSGTPGCEETAEGCYIPSTATVDVGGKVIMTNTDSAAHTFTSGNPTDGPDGIFDTSLLMVDGSYEWSPTEVGTVDYFCMVHPWMIGTVIVQEAPVIEVEIEDEFEMPEFTALPDWVKHIFIWYGEGMIDDETLIQMIQYLITEEIIQV